MSSNPTRDLVRRELAAQKQRIRAKVLTEPRSEYVDRDGSRFPTFVCDCDIGRNRVLKGVPVKIGPAGSRSFARPGAPVWLERDAAGRYQVVGEADRGIASAVIVELDEDAGSSVAAGTSGFTFKREPFTYYKGDPAGWPTAFYNPATDGAVRLWLRTYDRTFGKPANITTVTDTAGAQISALADKSGHGSSPAQTTATLRPLYRRFESTGGNVNTLCTADFDGTDDRMPLPGPVTEAAPGAVSIFCLANKDAASAGDDVLLELDHWRLLSRQSAADAWGVDQGGGILSAGAALGVSFSLLEVVASSFAAVELYQDGVQLASATPGGTGLALGSSTLGGSATLGGHNGRIAEVLVLDGAVTAAKRQQIEAYFRQSMFVGYSRWSNGIDGFPKIRVLDSEGNEVVL